MITTTPTAAGTVHGLALLYLNGNFLTRFHAHPANRNYRPAHKTPPNQSKSPLHVGTIMWVMKLANGLSAKFLDSLTSLSYADFDQSARRKELPLRKRAGRAVRWGKRQVSAVNQSNVGSKSRAVNVRVHTYTHTHTLTSTRRHTLKQKNTNIVFLSCREPSQQVS